MCNAVAITTTSFAMDACMLAERLLTRPGRAFLVLATALMITACKTEKDPEQPTVLGMPAPVAYLGVEYYYNFGVYGGDGILEYSLTNAPAWLALEDTSNKARQGIIMRGVPGLTGGNRGEQDLGKTVDVTLLTTDGQRVGLQPFDIDVRHNTVTLEAEGFEEGQYPTASSSDSESVCALPDLGEADAGGERSTGLHEYTAEVYDEQGEVITPLPASAQRSKETTPVLVKVLLAKPSVTRIRIAFELSSDFDPTSCEGSFSSPHQRCTHSPVNRGRAMIGQDVVGLGSASEDRLTVPEYLQYLPDDQGNLTRGVLTLEPGITECYIRLEVVSDDVPETSELFKVDLTDVREGLAALGSGDEGVSRTLTIRDNQTSVVFETEAGYQRDVINAGATRQYQARLENRLDADATYRVRLGQEEVSSAVPGDDYLIEIPDPDMPGSWKPVEELTFGPGHNELTFRVSALNGSAIPVDDDKVMVINADERFQDGREFYAAAQDSGLRLTINELISSLEVGSAGGFAPTDLALARNGEIALVGIDTTGFSGEPAGTPLVVVYDRKGVMADVVPVANLTVASEAPPLVSYNERPADVGNATVTREEIAVAFGSRDTLSGGTSSGGIDSIKVLLRYDTATESYAPVWRFQTGTAGDDVPRAIAMDRSGNLFVGGETTGTWPVQPEAGGGSGGATQANQGGVDSYVQRVGTELSGDTEVPALAWTRQQGSALDDRVYGVSIQGSSATLIGSSPGSVAGEPQLGGVDLFFYTASTAGGAITVRQLGTAGDDRIQDALLQGSDLWMTAAPNRYTRTEQTDSDGLVTATLTSSPLDSPAASVLGFSTVGNSQAALTLNDLDDSAVDQFDFLVPFNGELVTAGYTTGRFSEASAASGNSPILARLREVVPEPEPDPETDDSTGEGSGDDIAVEEDDDTVSPPVVAPGLESRWRVQRELNARTDGLVQYRGDKLIALIREGADGSETWSLNLFTGEGRLLNP